MHDNIIYTHYAYHNIFTFLCIGAIGTFEHYMAGQ